MPIDYTTTSPGDSGWEAKRVTLAADTATQVVGVGHAQRRVSLNVPVGSDIYVAPSSAEVAVTTSRASATIDDPLTINGRDEIWAISVGGASYIEAIIDTRSSI